MERAPTPVHEWLVALGKTAEWLIAYANQPGEAVGVTVVVGREASGDRAASSESSSQPAAGTSPQPEPESDG